MQYVICLVGKLKEVERKWKHLKVLQKVGLEFTQQNVKDAKYFIKDFVPASHLETLNSGQQILFAVDEFGCTNGEDSLVLVHDLLQNLEALLPLQKFEQMTGIKRTTYSPTCHHKGSPALLSNQPFHSTSLSLRHQPLESLSPLFTSLKSLLQGDARGTLTSLQDFLSKRHAGQQNHVLGAQVADVNVGNYRFCSLDQVLCPGVCSRHERSLILRVLMELSFRQTNLHEQTRWLVNLMTHEPALQLFCEVRMYKSGEFCHGNTLDYNTQSRRHHMLVIRCLILQEVITDDVNLTKFERYRHLALLSDALGLLEGLDPRGCTTNNIIIKQRYHDKARQVREEVMSSGEIFESLEGVLMLFDAYASLQSAGYARAVLSCVDSSKSFHDRMDVAKEAQGIHSESMNEQTKLMHTLGLSSEEICCTPTMLAARFDNMLRHLRPQQLSRKLGFPSNTQSMLSYLHTELGSIRELFDRIPVQNWDMNMRDLRNGMLRIGDELKGQIYGGTMDPFALDNPYIPE